MLIRSSAPPAGCDTHQQVVDSQLWGRDRPLGRKRSTSSKQATLASTPPPVGSEQIEVLLSWAS